MLQDIEVGSGGSNPQNILESNGMTYLVITTDELGDELFAGISTVVLPVSELTFNGIRKNEDALLTWTTRDELQTAQFEIERSLNGREFSRIGSVTAAGTPGTHRYEYTDAGIAAMDVAILYYRLKLVDRDARFTLSRTVALPVGGKNTVLLYPNPVQDEAILVVGIEKAARIQCRVVDNTGRNILTRQWDLGAGSHTLKIDVSSLAKGTYYLELFGLDTDQRKKFIKQ